MKTLTKLVLAAAMLTAAVSTKAEWVAGHFRSSGNYIQPDFRTTANSNPYDNLSYRAYPSQQPGCISSPSYGCRSYFSTPSTFSGTSTSFGGTTYHSYRDSLGGSWSGTTTRLGNTSYTTIRGW